MMRKRRLAIGIVVVVIVVVVVVVVIDVIDVVEYPAAMAILRANPHSGRNCATWSNTQSHSKAHKMAPHKNETQPKCHHDAIGP